MIEVKGDCTQCGTPLRIPILTHEGRNFCNIFCVEEWKDSQWNNMEEFDVEVMKRESNPTKVRGRRARG